MRLPRSRDLHCSLVFTQVDRYSDAYAMLILAAATGQLLGRLYRKVKLLKIGSLDWVVVE